MNRCVAFGAAWEVVLTNSDIEDAETTVTEEAIPTWIRWSTVTIPVMMFRTKDEQDKGNNESLAGSIDSFALPQDRIDAAEQFVKFWAQPSRGGLVCLADSG